MPGGALTMACGMFGKLAAKRDFISAGAPQNFLEVVEPRTGGGNFKISREGL